MSSIDTLVERLVDIRKLPFTNKETLSVLYKHKSNRDFILAIHKCYDHCEEDKIKKKEKKINHTLYFQCCCGSLCNHEYNSFVSCMKDKKGKPECSIELKSLTNCLDNRITTFYEQMINVKD